MKVIGEIVFMRGEVEPPYCKCCPPYDTGVPHAHVFNRHIKVPEVKSKIFGGVTNKSLNDYIGDYLCSDESLEGRTVQVTIKIKEIQE